MEIITGSLVQLSFEDRQKLIYIHSLLETIPVYNEQNQEDVIKREAINVAKSLLATLIAGETNI